MTIIQATHVILLYQGYYSYLAVYFYTDSIYKSLLNDEISIFE